MGVHFPIIIIILCVYSARLLFGILPRRADEAEAAIQLNLNST